MAPFAQPPRRRRRPLHLTARDLKVLEALIPRQVETLDFLYETYFPGVSKKRALNRLGELIAGGYLERTQVHLPGHDTPSSVYWLTRRAKNALDYRALGSTWFSTGTWKLEPDSPSIPHQICTNRVCDWLRASPVPEHLQPKFKKPDGTYLKHKPDAFYEARKARYDGANLVLLEVDLGHYSRKRILEKVAVLSEIPDARFLLIATITPQRCKKLQKLIANEFGSSIWNRVDVMSFSEIKAGTAPGHPRAIPELLPKKLRLNNFDVKVT